MNVRRSSRDATTPWVAKRPHRIWRWTGRVLLGMVAVIVFLLALGASYEAFMAAGDADRYPARGQLVDVGGYRLHIFCVGEGSPTVVLDAGLGGFSLDWSLVQPELAATTRVCAYDRAGYAERSQSSRPDTEPNRRRTPHLAGQCWHPRPLCVGGALGGGQARAPLCESVSASCSGDGADRCPGTNPWTQTARPRRWLPSIRSSNGSSG